MKTLLSDWMRQLESDKNGTAHRFVQDERGAASIEYLMLMLGLTLGCAAAIAAIGPDLIALFHLRVLLLSLPFP